MTRDALERTVAGAILIAEGDNAAAIMAATEHDEGCPRNAWTCLMCSQETALGIAQAAIGAVYEALREPSEAMMDAAYKLEGDVAPHYPGPRQFWKVMWPASALGPKP